MTFTGIKDTRLINNRLLGCGPGLRTTEKPENMHMRTVLGGFKSTFPISREPE